MLGRPTHITFRVRRDEIIVTCSPEDAPVRRQCAAPIGAAAGKSRANRLLQGVRLADLNTHRDHVVGVYILRIWYAGADYVWHSRHEVRESLDTMREARGFAGQAERECYEWVRQVQACLDAVEMGAESAQRPLKVLYRVGNRSHARDGNHVMWMHARIGTPKSAPNVFTHKSLVKSIIAGVNYPLRLGLCIQHRTKYKFKFYVGLENVVVRVCYAGQQGQSAGSLVKACVLSMAAKLVSEFKIPVHVINGSKGVKYV